MPQLPRGPSQTSPSYVWLFATTLSRRRAFVYSNTPFSTLPRDRSSDPCNGALVFQKKIQRYLPKTFLWLMADLPFKPLVFLGEI